MSFGEAVAIRLVAGGVTNAVMVVLADNSHRQRWAASHGLCKGNLDKWPCYGSSKETSMSASGISVLVDALALVGD